MLCAACASASGASAFARGFLGGRLDGNGLLPWLDGGLLPWLGLCPAEEVSDVDCDAGELLTALTGLAAVGSLSSGIAFVSVHRLHNSLRPFERLPAREIRERVERDPSGVLKKLLEQGWLCDLFRHLLHHLLCLRHGRPSSDGEVTRSRAPSLAWERPSP